MVYDNGRIIKRWREEVGVSIPQLASIAGLSASYVNLLEVNGIEKPGFEKLVSIGMALGRSLEDIDNLLAGYALKLLEPSHVMVSAFVSASFSLRNGTYAHSSDMISCLAHRLSHENVECSLSMITDGCLHSALLENDVLDHAKRMGLFSDVSQEMDENDVYYLLDAAIQQGLQAERRRLFFRDSSLRKTSHLVELNGFHAWVQYMQEVCDCDNFRITVERLFNDVFLFMRTGKYNVRFIDEMPPFCFSISGYDQYQAKGLKPSITFCPSSHAFQSSCLQKNILQIVTCESTLVKVFQNEFDGLRKKVLFHDDAEQTIKHMKFTLIKNGFNMMY